MVTTTTHPLTYPDLTKKPKKPTTYTELIDKYLADYKAGICRCDPLDCAYNCPKHSLIENASQTIKTKFDKTFVAILHVLENLSLIHI